MPVIHTVPQLIQASVGAAPEAFRAKIKRVFKPVTGQGQYGDWKLQNLIITDGQADIMCTFADREDVPMAAIGQQFYACATSSDKGMNGIKRKASKKDQKPEIWVSAAAEVTFEGGATPPPQNPPQQQRPTNGNGSHAPANGNGHPPANQAPQPPAGGIVDQHAAREATMKQFKIRVGRTSSALNVCIDAAIRVVKDVNERHGDIMGKPSPELLEKIAMGIMVNVCWTEKPGAVDTFPTRPFQYYEKPPQSAPPQRQGAPFDT